MSCEIHVGNITQFEITVAKCNGVVEDLSTATTIDFLFQKPDGSVVTRTGEFLTDGVDGVVVYRTNITDLDQSGSWKYQVHLIYSENEQYTDITKFKVIANLI